MILAAARSLLFGCLCYHYAFELHVLNFEDAVQEGFNKDFLGEFPSRVILAQRPNMNSGQSPNELHNLIIQHLQRYFIMFIEN